jgi:hypothetical protein
LSGGKGRWISIAFFVPNYLEITLTMSTINSYLRDEDSYDIDEQDEPTFQRLKKQTGKVTTIKDDRRQAGKEFGKRINKMHKERRRQGGPGKP